MKDDVMWWQLHWNNPPGETISQSIYFKHIQNTQHDKRHKSRE